MTEENLNYLSMDELLLLMVRTIDEYLILHKGQDHAATDIKRSELKTIQKLIKARQTENSTIHKTSPY